MCRHLIYTQLFKYDAVLHCLQVSVSLMYVVYTNREASYLGPQSFRSKITGFEVKNLMLKLGVLLKGSTDLLDFGILKVQLSLVF